ncbi:MAG: alpha/beta hydrolase [Candidatus Electrothrix aestuarii]|uniref:Alpha/beta hydrolase n=1 Tax=Candidatus Electrothrix aestuarii TaxID=3062594 RepID=A0AAU8LS03_9BACT|nr:alpha/beta hydrolase [Candidatus Electrothrix aestuarii]
MQIILLPGMDGTGMLFNPFIRELNKHIPEDVSVQVISYPCDQDLSYAELVDFVQEKLPLDEDIILVAESFSGPIAYALATGQKNRVQAVIFAATFLCPPQKALWKMPPRLVAPFLKIPLPIFLLKALFFDHETADETVALFRKASGKVRSSVFATRMREICTLRIERSSLDMSCAYVRAGKDHFVPGAHAEEFRILAPHIKLFDIPGPHFVLQARPEESAQAIGDFLSPVF